MTNKKWLQSGGCSQTRAGGQITKGLNPILHYLFPLFLSPFKIRKGVVVCAFTYNQTWELFSRVYYYQSGTLHFHIRYPFTCTSSGCILQLCKVSAVPVYSLRRMLCLKDRQMKRHFIL